MSRKIAYRISSNGAVIDFIARICNKFGIHKVTVFDSPSVEAAEKEALKYFERLGELDELSTIDMLTMSDYKWAERE